VRIVEEGALRPLIDMVRFPDEGMQRCSALAVNAVTLGPQAVTKKEVMHEEGLLPIMALVDGRDPECVKAGIYALGTLCEVQCLRGLRPYTLSLSLLGRAGIFPTHFFLL
jgi:hypothetical protein